MKIFLGLRFVLFCCLSMSIFLSENTPAEWGHGSDKAAPLGSKADSCLSQQSIGGVVDALAELDKKMLAVDENFDHSKNSEQYQKQLRRVVDETVSELSPQQQTTFRALVLKDQVTRSALDLQSETALLEALEEFEKSASEAQLASQKFSKSMGTPHALGFLGGVVGVGGAVINTHRKGDQALEASDAMTQASVKLRKAIEASGLSEAEKTELIKQATERESIAHRQLSLDAGKVETRAQAVHSVAHGTRDVAFGTAGALASLIYMRNATGAAMRGTQILHGTARLNNVLRGALTGAGTGALGAGGSQIAIGSGGNVVRALQAEGDFFCELAQQQDLHSDLIYQSAVSAAKRGAIYGGFYGGLANHTATSMLNIRGIDPLSAREGLQAMLPYAVLPVGSVAYGSEATEALRQELGKSDLSKAQQQRYLGLHSMRSQKDPMSKFKAYREAGFSHSELGFWTRVYSAPEEKQRQIAEILEASATREVQEDLQAPAGQSVITSTLGGPALLAKEASSALKNKRDDVFLSGAKEKIRAVLQ